MTHQSRSSHLYLSYHIILLDVDCPSWYIAVGAYLEISRQDMDRAESRRAESGVGPGPTPPPINPSQYIICRHLVSCSVATLIVAAGHQLSFDLKRNGTCGKVDHGIDRQYLGVTVRVYHNTAFKSLWI